MVASTSSACYTGCKVERDLSAMVSGKGSGYQFGISRKHPESAMNSSPLKVGKDSHRIRKSPLPLPQVQFRPPIIIHTYSPKIIHTQPDDFMSLVQKLTGSSDTRLRLKKDKAPSSSKKDKQASASSNKETSDATILERQGSGGSSSATVTNCGSPSSSEDSATFLVTEQSGRCGGEANTMKQSNSPRSPLDSNFEFDTVSDALLHQLSHFVDASAGGTMFNPQVKAEPTFSFHENNVNPFTFFSDFMHHPALQPASKPAPKPAPRPQMHQQHPDLMSPYLDNVVLSPNLLSPNLMPGMPDISLQGWSQGIFLDCLNGGASQAPGSHFVNQASPYVRQRQFSGPSYTLSSEGSTMVALENIHAYMLT